jgi:hypothetical protein
VVCVPDGCQGESFVATPVAANMLIVLDRSLSMRDNLNNNDGRKIDVATTAIDALVAAHAGQIRFGLAPFPGTNTDGSQGQDCGQGYVAVDVADNNAQPITDYLTTMGLSQFHTPTGEDLAGVVEPYTPLQDTARNNFVLLVTDGAANCSVDPAGEVAKLAAGQNGQFPPVKTFVVGFGSGVDAGQLTAMATAGGEALPGTPNYYQADSAADLNTIFGSIAQAALSCDYTLNASAGNDPNALLVFFNGVPVPRDATHATGWDYNPATTDLHFAGNACIALQSGSVTDLSIAFGCPAQAGEGEGEGEGAGGEGEGEGATGGEGEGEGSSNCGGTGAHCTKDADCCAGFLCNTQTQQCLFLGG